MCIRDSSQIWKGIISIYNEDTNESKSLIMGQFINNCVTLHQKSTQQYDLLTCNNDGHMYQCDISNRDVELVRRYSDLNFPLNNAALSHDGKTLIVSGDSNRVAIYKQDQLINRFTLNYSHNSNWGTSTNPSVVQLPSYSVHDNTSMVDSNIIEAGKGDHGFYNCFSENDMLFSTLFQNGVCLIYDVRNTSTPLAEISSTRPNSHNGAFRVCRFSYGLDDLLFISEHQGRVHVVDTRNFINHQVILIPDKLNTEQESTITPDIPQVDVLPGNTTMHFSSTHDRYPLNSQSEEYASRILNNDSTRSVSYTHLDVYKRQIQHRARISYIWFT